MEATDTVLYNLLFSLLGKDKNKIISNLELLSNNIKNNQFLDIEDLVALLMTTISDLAELGYLEEEEDENLVEFDVVTYPDEDPKKRLN